MRENGRKVREDGLWNEKRVGGEWEKKRKKRKKEGRKRKGKNSRAPSIKGPIDDGKP